MRLAPVLLLVLSCVLLLPAAAQAQASWANLQWPPTYTGSSCTGTGIYGQIWIDGLTQDPGQAPGIEAQLGFGAPGSTADDAWLWIDATFNTQAGNNDEYVVFLNHQIPVGTYDYAYRYRGDFSGGEWYYADMNGPAAGGVLSNPGSAEITETCGAVANGTVSWGMWKAGF